MDITTFFLHLVAEPTAWAVLFGVLAALPHFVALSPRVAQGLGVVSSLLNVIAGNYAAAANGKAMADRIVGALDQPQRAAGSGTPSSLSAIAALLFGAGPLLAAVMILGACAATGPADRTTQTLAALHVGVAAAHGLAPTAKTYLSPDRGRMLDAALEVADAALDRADRAQRDGDPVAVMAALEAASTALDQAQELLGHQPAGAPK